MSLFRRGGRLTDPLRHQPVVFDNMRSRELFGQ